MNLTDILALGVQTTPKLILAEDTNGFYAIPSGASGMDARAVNPTAYIGPVTLTGSSSSWSFASGSQAYIEQSGNISVSVSDIPNGHAGSLSVLVLSSGTIDMTFSGLIAKPYDLYYTLSPETLPANSWVEISFKRTDNVIRLFGNKRTAQPVPSTATTPEIGFNGGNLPYVSVEPVWEDAVTNGWRWFIDDVHDDPYDDITVYTGVLTDGDVIHVEFWAENPDNSALLNSADITYDETPPPPSGLLDGLLEWWEGGAAAGIHAGTTVSVTGSPIGTAPNGLAYRIGEGVNNAITPQIEVMADISTSSVETATFAWAGRVVTNSNNFEAIAAFENIPQYSRIGFNWLAEGGKVLRITNVYDVWEPAELVTLNQWFSVVITIVGNDWTLYVDGVSIGTITTEIYGTGTMDLDKIYGGGNGGEIDHAVVAVASRAWSPTEVAEFHNAGAFRTYASL